MKTTLVFLVASLSLFSMSVSAQLVNECGGNASIDGASYLIQPSGGDDKDTIECALNSAKSQGIEKVALASGEFSLSGGFIVENYLGSLEGVSRTATTINVTDAVLDCADTSLGTQAVMGFRGGDVRLRFFTINTNNPCATAGDFTVLSFSSPSCDSRTYFTEIDRVGVIGNPNVQGEIVGILSGAAQICNFSGQSALGTFKLNRSIVSGFQRGVQTTIGGAGQVDINFNEFSNDSTSIQIVDANQSTTITGNTFNYGDRVSENGFGGAVVVATAGEFGVPTANRTVVHKNTFIQGTVNGESTAISITNRTVRASHSVVVTNNNITMSNTTTGFESAIQVLDIDGALISNNTLRGSADVGVVVGSLFQAQPSRNSIISGNNFAFTPSSFDVWLFQGSEASIVGDQNEVTQNDGTGNFVLGSSASAMAFGEKDELFRRFVESHK